MFKEESERRNALQKTLPPPQTKLNLLTKFANYLEVEKCIHDLITQQQLMTKSAAIGFVWIRKIVFSEDSNTRERYYYNADADMLCPLHESRRHFNVCYLIPTFPCNTFPTQFDHNIYEYAIAKFIQLKTFNKDFDRTKVGYFLQRALKRRNTVPIFI